MCASRRLSLGACLLLGGECAVGGRGADLLLRRRCASRRDNGAERPRARRRRVAGSGAGHGETGSREACRLVTSRERAEAGAQRAAAGDGDCDGDRCEPGRSRVCGGRRVQLSACERRRPARGERPRQPSVQRRRKRPLGGERSQLRDLGLRGGRGTDRELRAGRPHRHRRARLHGGHARAGLPDRAGLDGSGVGRARVGRGTGVVLHTQSARQLDDERRRAGAARHPGGVHPTMARAGAGAGLARDRLRRPRAPARRRDAGSSGGDARDDGRRSVGDRRSDRHRRRARTVGRRGERGHAGSGARRHPGASAADARGQHGRPVRRSRRRSVVLSGVRRRALVCGTGAARPASAERRIGDRRRGAVCRRLQREGLRSDLRGPRRRAAAGARAERDAAARGADQRGAVPRAARRTRRRATRSTTATPCCACCAAAATRPAAAARPRPRPNFGRRAGRSRVLEVFC